MDIGRNTLDPRLYNSPGLVEFRVPRDETRPPEGSAEKPETGKMTNTQTYTTRTN